MRSERQAGFTLTELMVVIAIVAILAALAVPSFQQSIRSNRVATATNEMLASLSLARSEAIRNKAGGGVCPSANGTACGGDWSDGWLVWADTNGNGTLDAGETVLRYRHGTSELTVTSDDTTVAFDPRGRRRGNSDQAFVLRPTECGGQPLQRTVAVNASGQVTTTRGNCS